MTEPRPWRRQADESEEAYEAFALYRDLGGLGTVRTAAAIRGKHRSLFFRWSKEHRWVARIEAWNRFQNLDPNWAESVDTERSIDSEPDSGKAAMDEQIALDVSKEIRRRIDEDPGYLEGLPLRTLMQLVNTSRRSSPRSPQRAPTEDVSALVVERDGKWQVTDEVLRELLEMKTVLVITKGIIEPADASYKSLYSYSNWDDEALLFGPNLPEEWLLKTYLREYLGPFNVSRGWYVVDGPPADVNPRQTWWPIVTWTDSVPREPDINPDPPFSRMPARADAVVASRDF